MIVDDCPPTPCPTISEEMKYSPKKTWLMIRPPGRLGMTKNKFSQKQSCYISLNSKFNADSESYKKRGLKMHHKKVTTFTSYKLHVSSNLCVQGI